MDRRQGARVAFGLPAANAETHFAEAIESLLAQTRTDFSLAIVDDCSTDGTLEVARAYAELDSRVSVHANPSRLGLVGNWRRAQELALGAAPAAVYFAWASDHDIWHEQWLEALVAELDSHPAAVLAFPLTLRISERGADLGGRPRTVDTADQHEPSERLRTVIHKLKAGDAIYGLMRRDALLRCGQLPLAASPDRLLLTRLALEGEFRQLPRLLWYRRYREGVRASAARQRRSFYPDGAPLRAYVPWPIAHGILFARGELAANVPAGMEGLAGLQFRETLRFAGNNWLQGHMRAIRRRRRQSARRLRMWRGRVPAPIRGMIRPLLRLVRRTPSLGAGRR
jgi:glycosyltransferase involved in cell wall biosynthesis